MGPCSDFLQNDGAKKAYFLQNEPCKTGLYGTWLLPFYIGNLKGDKYIYIYIFVK